MIYILIIVGITSSFFALRFFLLTHNLKKAQRELEEIMQNPQENSILHNSVPQKHAERLLASMNEYILAARRERIFYENREKKLRAQIENISHDLRTPLTSLIGYLDILDQDSLNEENRESLEVIERKARALHSLIGNFYDLSRLELDDYHLTMEAMDLARFTDETMLQFYMEFEKRNLTVEINKKTPGGPVLISADNGALTRIFYNMNQNVLRYAVSQYRVNLKEENGMVLLIFENDCNSLKEEDIAHLFERFYVKEASRTNESTGLGLTINRLLTEAMGGTVRAELEGNWFRAVYEFRRLNG